MEAKINSIPAEIRTVRHDLISVQTSARNQAVCMLSPAKGGDPWTPSEKALK